MKVILFDIIKGISKYQRQLLFIAKHLNSPKKCYEFMIK